MRSFHHYNTDALSSYNDKAYVTIQIKTAVLAY